MEGFDWVFEKCAWGWLNYLIILVNNQIENEKIIGVLNYNSISNLI